MRCQAPVIETSTTLRILAVLKDGTSVLTNLEIYIYYCIQLFILISPHALHLVYEPHAHVVASTV